MIKFNVPYKNRVIFPCKAKVLFQDICNQAGVEAGNLDFINCDYMILGNPFTNNEDCRTVLSNISQLAGGFAKIGRDNKVYIRTLKNISNLLKVKDINKMSVKDLNLIPVKLLTTEKQNANENLDGNTYFEDFIKNNMWGELNSLVLGLSSIEGENTALDDKNSIKDNGLTEIVINDNYFLINDVERQKVITPMWNALKGIKYLPFETEYYGFPYLDSGDLIYVEDSKDKGYVSYVFNHTFTFNGGYSGKLETPALTKIQTAYKNTINMKKMFKNVERKIDKINGVIEDIIEENTETSNKLSQHKQTIDNITDTLSSQETKIETAQSTADKATSKADANAKSIQTTTTKLTEVEKTVDGITQSVSKVEEKIDNTKVGGRNLLKHTSFENTNGVSVRGSYATISIDTSNKYNGNNSLKVVTTASAVSGSKDIWQKCWSNQEKDRTIKLSLYVKGSVTAKAWFRLAGAGSTKAYTTGKFDVTTSWTKLEIDLGTVSNAGTTGQTEIIYGFDTAGTYYINSMKLEYGDKYTDWTPAPEDLENNLSENYYTKIEADSKITQKANEIKSTVSENISTAKTEAINSANESINNKLENYSTTTQMNSEITQKANEINAEVNKKVNNSDYTKANIILKINDNTSEAKINADVIELSANDILNLLAGNTINLKTHNIVMTSDNFNLDKNGNMTCSNANLTGTVTATAGKFGKFTIKDGNLYVRNGNIETEISEDGFNIWGIHTVLGVEVKVEVLRIARVGNNTIINLKGLEDGTSILTVDNANITNLSPDTKIQSGRIMHSYPDGDYEYRCYWTGSRLEFYVDAANVTANVSDKRLKTDIEEVDEDLISAIGELKYYQFKKINKNGLISVGIIAQDLIEKLEKYGKNAKDYEILEEFKYKYDDETLYFGINYEQFLLFRMMAKEKEIKNLQEKDKQKDEIIEDLIKRIEKLEEGGSK